MTSEVARVLAQIDLEIEAFRRLFHDPAQVASHAAIERRMDALGSRHEALCALVPAEEAARTLITVMNTVADYAQSHPEQQTEPVPEQSFIKHAHPPQEELESTMPQPPTPALNSTQASNKSLIHARLARRWSKKETARRLGISSVVYSAWETGRHEPTLPHLRTLCQLFASPPEALGFPVYLPASRVEAPSGPIQADHRSLGMRNIGE